MPSRSLIEQDGNIQVLLETEAVTRSPWMAPTANGSEHSRPGVPGLPDGTEQVLHFVENSPLPKQHDVDLAIDGRAERCSSARSRAS